MQTHPNFRSCRLFLPILVLMTLSALAAGQQLQTNGFFNSLAINSAATMQVAMGPSTASVFTDSPIAVDMQGQANSPVVLLYSINVSPGSTISLASFSQFNIQLDLADVGAAGFGDQVLVDGYARPFPNTFTDGTGNWNAPFQVPACTFVAGVAVCISVPNFEVSVQGIVQDPVNGPFFVSSTGAGTASFTNCYTLFPDSGGNDQFWAYNFPGGFTFSFYGNTYSSAFVSENGYIQFGSAAGMTTFPNVSVNFINDSQPKIMSFFTDLVHVAQGGSTPRVYAQCFTQNGVRKIRFVHQTLQEFGNSTGGHGGQITIAESGEIAVFVAGYNSFPTINTGVGILDGIHPSSQFATAFGRDLSADIGLSIALGAGVPGFEHFDHNPAGPGLNPIDLIGVAEFNTNGVGPGITYIPDPTVSPFTFGYIIL